MALRTSAYAAALPALLDDIADSSASVAAAAKRMMLSADPMVRRVAMRARLRQPCGRRTCSEYAAMIFRCGTNRSAGEGAHLPPWTRTSPRIRNNQLAAPPLPVSRWAVRCWRWRAGRLDGLEQRPKLPRVGQENKEYPGQRSGDVCVVIGTTPHRLAGPAVGRKVTESQITEREQGRRNWNGNRQNEQPLRRVVHNRREQHCHDCTGGTEGRVARVVATLDAGDGGAGQHAGEVEDDELQRADCALEQIGKRIECNEIQCQVCDVGMDEAAGDESLISRATGDRIRPQHRLLDDSRRGQADGTDYDGDYENDRRG